MITDNDVVSTSELNGILTKLGAFKNTGKYNFSVKELEKASFHPVAMIGTGVFWNRKDIEGIGKLLESMRASEEKVPKVVVKKDDVTKAELLNFVELLGTDMRSIEAKVDAIIKEFGIQYQYGVKTK